MRYMFLLRACAPVSALWLFLFVCQVGHAEQCPVTKGTTDSNMVSDLANKDRALEECIKRNDAARDAERAESDRVNAQQIEDAKALASDVAKHGVVDAVNSAGNTALDRKIGSLMGGDAQSSDPNVQALQAHLDKAYDKLNTSDPVAKAFATASTEKTVGMMSNAQGQLEAALRSAEALGSNRSSAMANAITSFGTLRASGQTASTDADSPGWNAAVARAQVQAQQAQQVADREIASANEQRRENAILSAERQDAEIRNEAAQLVRQGQISGWAHAAAALSPSGSSSVVHSGASGNNCEAIGPGHPMC